MIRTIVTLHCFVHQFSPAWISLENTRFRSDRLEKYALPSYWHNWSIHERLTHGVNLLEICQHFRFLLCDKM
jgi:hypothetical protein